jgi:hypothetical protein
MIKIFISYSRIDKPFLQGFVPIVDAEYSVWFDEQLLGGDDWWQEILHQINQCHIFIYLLSNESIQSPTCEKEYTEAKRLQKPIITILTRSNTEIPHELRKIQYIDFSKGRDSEIIEKLHRSIQKKYSQIPSIPLPPRYSNPTRRPDESRIEFINALSSCVSDPKASFYAHVTDNLYKGLWKRTGSQLRTELNLSRQQSIRDHFGKYAVIYTSLAEKIIAERLKQVGMMAENDARNMVLNLANQIGSQAEITRNLLGYDLVTEKPLSEGFSINL